MSMVFHNAVTLKSDLRNQRRSFYVFWIPLSVYCLLYKLIWTQPIMIFNQRISKWVTNENWYINGIFTVAWCIITNSSPFHSINVKILSTNKIKTPNVCVFSHNFSRCPFIDLILPGIVLDSLTASVLRWLCNEKYHDKSKHILFV